MLALIFKRLLSAIPVLLIVATIVFLIVRLSGDPAPALAGDTATAEQIERIRIALGLDKPPHVQFFAWLWQLARGDLGTSIYNNLPVTTLIGQRLEPTIMLTLTTIVFSVLVGVTLGTLAAWKAGTWLDRIVMVLSVAGFSVPVFVVGYLLIYAFAGYDRLFPVQGYRSPFTDPLQFVRYITLPTLALSAIFVALLTRITRAAVLEVLGEDYVRTARAKGQVERVVLFRHALRNAAAPIITVIGLGFALLIGGAVVTETVFVIDGLGRLVFTSILNRDYPVIQGMILFFAFIYVVLNLVIDIAYTAFDPRIRY